MNKLYFKYCKASEMIVLKIQKNFFGLKKRYKLKYLEQSYLTNLSKMEGQDVAKEYNLVKIPQLQHQEVGKKNKVIIGLIDASGSMGSFWPSMVKFWNERIAPEADILITFSHAAKVQPQTFLKENISAHGGGMTNILAAFQKLEEKLINVDQKASITIVFISDGDDTVNGVTKLTNEMTKLRGGQGRDIIFLCLGIQSGFPTKISMQLRELYHTGDETIPAIYLIEYASEKAFFNKFQTMSKCFKASNTVSIKFGKQGIKQYPWQENGSIDPKQGKWMMVHKELPRIEMIYNQKTIVQIKPTTLKEIPLEDFVDCLRGWVQKVQLISMDNRKIEETKKIARKTGEVMRNYTLEYEKLNQIVIISENKDKKESFKDRAMGLAVKNIGSRIKWYLDELAIIEKGVGIGQLNEYEAAKRIGIGTITGKYHQKALALKGITVNDFLEIKKQFAETFKKVKLSEKPSNQEGSIFTLQNQKEVFQQPDFVEGLQFCKSQFDLVETFPVVGYGLKVKRYDGSMINPWKVCLQSLAKTHKTIDSMYLAKNSNKYELSIGEDEKEQINAVLPLFDLDDEQMSDLLNTRLFRLAVSFMVVQNIDTYHEEAYLALLGTTFVFLLKQPKSEWRDSLIDRIYTSIKVTYGATQKFRDYILSIEKNPFNLWKDKGKEDHVDIVKVLIIMFYIARQGRVTQQYLNHLAELALVHYCQKTYVENQFKIFRVCQIEVKDNDKEVKKEINVNYKQQLKEKEFGEINTLKSIDELKSLVDEDLKKFVSIDGVRVVLFDKIFLHQDQDKRVTYTQVSNFYEMLTGKPLKKEEKEILYYFGHYLKGVTEENYLNPIVKNMEDVEKTVLMKLNIKDLGLHQGREFKSLRRKIENRYVDHFRETHFFILPMTVNKLKSECDRLNIDYDKLHLNASTGMIQNACMSPHCKFYLIPMKNSDFMDHLRLWRGAMPARFHMTVVNFIKEEKTPEQICENLFKMNLVNIKKHQKNPQFVKSYIEMIQKSLTQDK